MGKVLKLSKSDQKIFDKHKGRGFSKGTHKAAAKASISQGQSSLSDTTMKAPPKTLFKTIQKSGKTGPKVDLSHKISHDKGRVIQKHVVADFGKMSQKRKQAIGRLLNTSQPEAIGSKHQKAIAGGVSLLSKKSAKGSTLTPKEKRTMVAAIHSSVNGSTANLRHMDASENRARGSSFHPNTSGGGALSPRSKTLKSVNSAFK